MGRLLLGVLAIVLCFVALRATEAYTSRYQSLPALDWVESRPPLAEAASVPTAADLARGLARTMPLLVMSDDPAPWLPVFGPPAVIQRSIGGVRDATRMVLASPGTVPPNQAPVQVRLYTVVFNRSLRAAEWAKLMSSEMDTRDPDTGLRQARVSGPEETDPVWIVSPRQTGGIATVVGYRGPVAFDLQVTVGPTPDVLPPNSTEKRAEVAELSARAEVAARRAAADYVEWLRQELDAVA